MNEHCAFTAGPGVYGERFFGRKKLLDTVRKHMASDGSVVLIGQRRIGKTSILAQIRHLESLDGSLVLVVNIHGDMLWGSNAPLNKIFPHRLYSAIQRACEENGLDVATIKDRNRIDEYAVIDVLESIRHKGYKIFLLFDDFDIAFRENDPTIAMIVRSMISQDHLVAAFAASLWPEQMEMFNDLSAPWANVFSLVSGIGNLELNEGKELLDVLSHKSGRKLSRREVSAIIGMFGTQPYYLQCVGMKLFIHTEYRTSKRKRKEEFARGLELAVFELLHYHMVYIISYLRDSDLELLKLVADNKIEKTKSQNESDLIKLKSIGLLDKEDTDYRISNNLLGNFLREMPNENILSKIREFGQHNSPRWTAFASDVFNKSVEQAIKVAIGSLA